MLLLLGPVVDRLCAARVVTVLYAGGGFRVCHRPRCWRSSPRCRCSSSADGGETSRVRLPDRTLLKALDEHHADPAGKGRGGDRGHRKTNSSGAGDDKGER
jgi:hypothetical protein